MKTHVSKWISLRPSIAQARPGDKVWSQGAVGVIGVHLPPHAEGCLCCGILEIGLGVLDILSSGHDKHCGWHVSPKSCCGGIWGGLSTRQLSSFSSHACIRYNQVIAVSRNYEDYMISWCLHGGLRVSNQSTHPPSQWLQVAHKIQAGHDWLCWLGFGISPQYIPDVPWLHSHMRAQPRNISTQSGHAIEDHHDIPPGYPDPDPSRS